MVEQSSMSRTSNTEELEEYFDLEGVDDEDEVRGNPFHPAQGVRPLDESVKIPLGKKSSSTKAPNYQAQTMSDIVSEREFLEKKIKPELQKIIKNLEIEERGKTEKSDPGECLTFFMEEKMLSELLGQSMANRPHGLLFLTLKLSMYIVKHVKSFSVLTLSENHQALF